MITKNVRSVRGISPAIGRTLAIAASAAALALSAEAGTAGQGKQKSTRQIWPA